MIKKKNIIKKRNFSININLNININFKSIFKKKLIKKH